MRKNKRTLFFFEEGVFLRVAALEGRKVNIIFYEKIQTIPRVDQFFARGGFLLARPVLRNSKT